MSQVETQIEKLEKWKLAIVNEIGDAVIYTAKLGERLWIAVARSEKDSALAIYKDGKLLEIRGGYIGEALAELMGLARAGKLNVKTEVKAKILGLAGRATSYGLLKRLLGAIHRPANKEVCIRISSEIVDLIQELAIEPGLYRDLNEFITSAIAIWLSNLMTEREEGHKR